MPIPGCPFALFLRQTEWAGRQEGLLSPLAGQKPSLLSALHIEWQAGPAASRIMTEGAAAPVSPLVRGTKRDSEQPFPRNISTRKGVCRVEPILRDTCVPAQVNAVGKPGRRPIEEL